MRQCWESARFAALSNARALGGRYLREIHGYRAGSSLAARQTTLCPTFGWKKASTQRSPRTRQRPTKKTAIEVMETQISCPFQVFQTTHQVAESPRRPRGTTVSLEPIPRHPLSSATFNTPVATGVFDMWSPRLRTRLTVHLLGPFVKSHV